MTCSTSELFGRCALHKIFAEDYIDWAGDMLARGYDSPNLRILAGLDRRDSIMSIEKYFLNSISELNIKHPTEKIAIQSYACELAQQIVEGKFTSLREAIQTLYQIWLNTDYDEEYQVWHELDDALDDLQAGEFPYAYPSATLNSFDELLKQEAAKFIARLANQN